MANNMEQFKPQPGGFGQAPVRTAGGPQLGATFALTAAPMAVQPQNGAPASPPMVQQSVGMGQSPISSPQIPRAASPVTLVGQPSPIQAQQPSMPMSPPPRPAMGQSQPAAPFLTKAPTQQQPQGNVEVHTISVVGLGSDGKKYLAEFDAVFPPGTKIEDVSERIN